ncbi:hypothetical protein HPP92_013957 [Vanilla planifolia]|uniref:Uncharacterized protein n=1 Tax=Vanilla planifolia TaxID=51239 RepID=A0A835QNK3_VANPL|nr:hypothetical protein HPP92_013957 [Vanilla planifolia]
MHTPDNTPLRQLHILAPAHVRDFNGHRDPVGLLAKEFDQQGGKGSTLQVWDVRRRQSSQKMVDEEDHQNLVDMASLEHWFSQ